MSPKDIPDNIGKINFLNTNRTGINKNIPIIAGTARAPIIVAAIQIFSNPLKILSIGLNASCAFLVSFSSSCILEIISLSLSERPTHVSTNLSFNENSNSCIEFIEVIILPSKSTAVFTFSKLLITGLCTFKSAKLPLTPNTSFIKPANLFILFLSSFTSIQFKRIPNIA